PALHESQVKTTVRVTSRPPSLRATSLSGRQRVPLTRKGVRKVPSPPTWKVGVKAALNTVCSPSVASNSTVDGTVPPGARPPTTTSNAPDGASAVVAVLSPVVVKVPAADCHSRVSMPVSLVDAPAAGALSAGHALS